MKIVEKPSLGTTKEAIIATLLTNGISNGDELQKKWVIWFRETFGKSELGVFLGWNLRHINLAELQELTEKLGWTMKIEEKVEKPSLGTTKEAIIATLLTHGITNGVELQKKWPVWFEKIFGRKDFNKFIWKTAQKTTLASLQELGEQLGWTVSKK